jgi:hypothetical protein
MTGELDDVAAQVWRLAGGPADAAGVLTISGPRSVWPAFFDVTGLAAGSVAGAALAAAEFLAARNQTRPQPVSVDNRAACAAFAAERLFTPVGWSRPELWEAAFCRGARAGPDARHCGPGVHEVPGRVRRGGTAH